MPTYIEISEAARRAQQRREACKNACLQVANRQIAELVRQIRWPFDLIRYAKPGTAKELSSAWQGSLQNASEFQSDQLAVDLRLETQFSKFIFCNLSVLMIENVFILTVAGVSRAIPDANADIPEFWVAVSTVLRELAEREAR